TTAEGTGRSGHERVGDLDPGTVCRPESGRRVKPELIARAKVGREIGHADADTQAAGGSVMRFLRCDREWSACEDAGRDHDVRQPHRMASRRRANGLQAWPAHPANARAARSVTGGGGGPAGTV